jgi:hypothetical protein
LVLFYGSMLSHSSLLMWSTCLVNMGTEFVGVLLVLVRMSICRFLVQSF